MSSRRRTTKNYEDGCCDVSIDASLYVDSPTGTNVSTRLMYCNSVAELPMCEMNAWFRLFLLKRKHHGSGCGPLLILVDDRVCLGSSTVKTLSKSTPR